MPVHHEWAWFALAITAGMVTTVTLCWLGLLQAAMLAAGLMLIGRCTTASAAR